MTSRSEASRLRPYVGLRPFESHEHLLLFGRAAETDHLLERLRRDRLLAITGAKGSGKSSLVRAGLLPALHGGLLAGAGTSWRTAVFRPGDDPVGALARTLSESQLFNPEEWHEPEREAVTEAVLRQGSLGLLEAVRQARLPPGENLLVVVDQFEDLFRLAAGREDSEAFVKLLLEAAGQVELPVYVIITLSAAYLGECSRFQRLPEAMGDGPHLVPRLTRDEAREALIGPARVCRAKVAPRLIDRMLNDMGSDPERLPLFQHALMRTWERWQNDSGFNEPIDIHHYEAIGAMSEALQNHAEEAFEELPDERSREVTMKLFATLAKPCASSKEVRCVMRLKDLCALTEVPEAIASGVVDAFRREGRSFLAPAPLLPLNAESLVEISYENLVYDWPRLSALAGQAAR